MKRWRCAPRPDWLARVEAQGMLYHTAPEHGVYWGEGTYYELTGDEVRTIEAATAELHHMCVAAVAHVIARERYAELDLGPLAVQLVEQSWARQSPGLYGRLDLALGPDGVPKLLEYNADTPTSLLEGAVIQWTWQAECFPAADQYNLLHDRLIAAWQRLAPELGEVVHFACVEELEDEMTVGYLRDTCEQAGLRTIGLTMEDIGWDPARAELVDLDDRPIRSLFKLYPWEGLVLDELAPVLAQVTTAWLEPAWKMMLSNKAILPILWELYPGHPNLLPAAREPGRVGDAFVQKPLYGREGANVRVSAPGVDVATPGPYYDRGFVYQAYAELGDHDGMRPVVGSWLVDGAPAGIGVREIDGYVHNNTARFVPHVVR